MHPHLAPSLRTIILALIFVLFGAGVAQAQFAVCNQTFDVVNVAIGKETSGTFRTDGWWTIGANQCADVIRDELASRYIFVYAMDVFGRALLDGKQSMCVGDKRFSIEGIDSCWQRGLRAADFAEVDTQQSPRWTLFLRDPQPPK